MGFTLVFDNFVESGINQWGTFDPSAPAMRELETIVVTDGSTFYVFHTEKGMLRKIIKDAKITREEWLKLV